MHEYTLPSETRQVYYMQGFSLSRGRASFCCGCMHMWLILHPQHAPHSRIKWAAFPFLHLQSPAGVRRQAEARASVIRQAQQRDVAEAEPGRSRSPSTDEDAAEGGPKSSGSNSGNGSMHTNKEGDSRSAPDRSDEDGGPGKASDKPE